MQALGVPANAGIGGDREVMLAFKVNEAQGCEKYTRAATHAGEWPEEVREILTTAADDEARHYEWAESQLETLGVEPESAAGRATRKVERVQARLADAAEALEHGGRRGLSAARRRAAEVRARLPERLPERPSNRALAVGAIAAGVGFLVTAALGTALRDRR
jgi:plasmid stability protein